MEPKQFNLAIDQLCEEKGITRQAVIETIEAALASAYKKDYGKKGQNIRVKFNGATAQTQIFLVKTVMEPKKEEEEDKTEKKLEDKKLEKEDKDAEKKNIEKRKEAFNPEKNITLEEAKKIKKDAKIGDEIMISLETPSGYGRIAAQTAKQVIIQRIREAEKKAIFDEYKAKEGEVISGIIQRIERGNVFVDIGKTIGILFPQEQITSENYRLGQRIKVYILKVEEGLKDSGVVLSHTHPQIVRKLFELEVPEIASGTVEIKNIAREAGSRSKVAVTSAKEGIDPIGSCVGQKGSRIQAVINELGEEKVDIIEWSKDVVKFIKNSLAPAKVASVNIDEARKKAIVEVPEDQLSLAIGKNGQNVRLAAKLTGWKIDVVMEKKEKSEDEKEKEEKEKKDKVREEKSREEKIEKKKDEKDKMKKKKKE